MPQNLHIIPPRKKCYETDDKFASLTKHLKQFFEKN